MEHHALLTVTGYSLIHHQKILDNESSQSASVLTVCVFVCVL